MRCKIGTLCTCCQWKVLCKCKIIVLTQVCMKYCALSLNYGPWSCTVKVNGSLAAPFNEHTMKSPVTNCSPIQITTITWRDGDKRERDSLQLVFFLGCVSSASWWNLTFETNPQYLASEPYSPRWGLDGTCFRTIDQCCTYLLRNLGQVTWCLCLGFPICKILISQRSVLRINDSRLVECFEQVKHNVSV